MWLLFIEIHTIPFSPYSCVDPSKIVNHKHSNINNCTSVIAGEDLILNDYRLCGWHVMSEVALPYLEPWASPSNLPDITVRLSPLPDRLSRASDATPRIQVTQEGTALVTAPGVGRYLLTGASDILAEPAASSSPDDNREIRCLADSLLDSVFGLLFMARGLLTLQGSAVGIGGRAVLLTGPAGSGKSALASALIRRGHALLSDDIAVIDASARIPPEALPTFARIKHWDDGTAPADPDSLDWRKDGRRGYSFHPTPTAAPTHSPLALRAVVNISGAGTAASQSLSPPLSPGESLAVLDKALYRKRVADGWGLTPGLFQKGTRVANAASVHHLTVDTGREGLEAAADQVERLMSP